MSGKIYNLSEKAMTEKYEDYVFTKVMALYAEEESAKILRRLEEEPFEADPKAIEKIYSKIERRENLSTVWKYSRKLLQFAAMVVFVAVVSVSSVVVASADAREAVAEALYHLVLEEHEKYTRVSIGEGTDFVDPELYDWEGAYAPTYMPEGYGIGEIHSEEGLCHTIVYYNNEKFVVIDQMNNSFNLQIDTENADTVKEIQIGESVGLLVVKDDITVTAWNTEDVLFEVSGTAPTEEIIKIAEGLKPIGKIEGSKPKEEYTFIDPELYDWEGAYAPTYMPEGFAFYQKQKFGSQSFVDYMRGDEYISFLQAGDVIFQVDTENAEINKKIIIGESEGLLVSENGNTYLNWCIENTNFQIYGTCEIEEIIKIAEGIKPIN